MKLNKITIFFINREEMEIKIKGNDIPKPIVSFAHLSFDEVILAQMTKKGFEKPTAIQCQVIPSQIP